MLQNIPFIAPIARILLSLHFLVAGFSKVFDASVRDRLIPWIDSKLFAGDIIVWIVGIFELVAVLCLIVGFKTRWVGLLLAIFTLLTAFIFHNYWTMEGQAVGTQSLFFWKNISIAGGMLAIAYFGAGPMAVDKD